MPSIHPLDVGNTKGPTEREKGVGFKETVDFVSSCRTKLTTTLISSCSYVFHDKCLDFVELSYVDLPCVFLQVRVPLNTACKLYLASSHLHRAYPGVAVLAVQNMAASGTVAKNQEIEFNALSGSLSMMS
jgi:hypothetical protein